jgi:branched-chain amino acid transport system ATP-binding protein
MLEIRGLTVGYSTGAAIVQDLDLDVASGEMVAILGANGAGKTTTLLAIAGFLHPLAGTITLNGHSIVDVAPHVIARRGLGYVTDDRALLKSLTVAENLAIIRNVKIDPFELFPPLANLRDRRAGLLSGGEQQMLALARTVASAPDLLVVDEPSQGLAPIIVTRLFDALRTARSEWGIGVLVVEQHVAAALAVVDRAYLMVDGQAVLSDDAATLAKRPDLLASSYLGTHQPR